MNEQSHVPPATIDEIITRARDRLERGVYQWAASGAGEGVTVARNRLALNSLALVPNVARDVSTVVTSTSWVGIEMAMPVFLAPVAALGIFDPGDAEAAGQAAAHAEIPGSCPILTSSPWKAVSATSPGRHIFQVYVFGDRSWLSDLLAEVEDLGFGAVCVTLDAAVLGRRDRSIETGYLWSAPSEGTVNLRDRGWDPEHRASFTWKDFEWLCGQTTLPVIAKGVMSPGDATRAIECGAESVYVSNHGGRMVDHGLSTIEALPAVVEVVGDSAEVVIDGGFTRGVEILKAVALGAKAVGLGKLQCWGLSLDGDVGLRTTLQILAEEIRLTMASLGCADLTKLTPELVRSSHPAKPSP